MSNRHQSGNVMRSFKGGDVTTTSSPTMTSFSSRKAPKIEPLKAPSADQIIQQRDGSLASSPYANRSLQRNGARNYDDDVIELPPEMQSMANNYQQSRKSNVIRIDARNLSERGDTGSIKRRAPANRGPLSPQPPSNPSIDGGFPRADSRRIVKTNSASSMSRAQKHQSAATPPPPQFTFNQPHPVSATPPPPGYGQLPEYNNLPEDATLPYQHPRPASARVHGSSLERNEPQQLHNGSEQGGWYGKSNGRSTGQRVTFAPDEAPRKVDIDEKRPREVTDGKKNTNNGQQNERGKLKPGQQLSDEPNKELNPLHQPKVLCIICFLAVLLIITIILLAHFASRGNSTRMGSDVSKESSREKASETPPPQTFSNVPTFPRVTRVPTSRDLDRKRYCLRKDCVRSAGVVLSKMDKRRKPCEDFYAYSCGGWLKENYIRLNSDQYGISNEIAERNDRILYELLLRPALNKTAMIQGNISYAEEKAKKFYKSCIDEMTIEDLGGRPLVAKVTSLGGWDALGSWNESAWDLDELIYQNQGVLSTSVLFGIDIDIDPTNTSKYILLIGQNGILTLPDRSLYLLKDNNPELLERLFKKAARKLLKLLGASDIERVVNEIYSFERELAKIQVPFDEIAQQPYLKIPIRRLERLCPMIGWFRLFRRIVTMVPLTPDTKVLIQGTENYFRNLSKLIKTTEQRVIHNYIMWRFAFSWSSRLSIPFRSIAPDFQYDLTGKKVSLPRTDECLRYVKQQFPDALGLMYIRETFPPTDKAKITEITNYVKRAFISNLDDLAWANGSKGREMVEKLNQMDIKIGYDERMYQDNSIVDRKYQVSADAFEVRDNAFFNNYMESVKSKIWQAANKLVGSVDTNAWALPFYSTGAFYVRRNNEMILPAGLLQPPMFDSKAPEVVNYGSIGSTIAHELLHGFEDWLQDNQPVYACAAKLYSSYEVKSLKQNVNGYRTMAENIADMGGLRIVFKAYKLWMSENAGVRRSLPGTALTSEQLFFVSFAQSWCMKRTFRSQQIQLSQGVHAPERYRVIGSVSNFNQFAKAFQCQQGSPMRPAEQCVIW